MQLGVYRARFTQNLQYRPPVPAAIKAFAYYRFFDAQSLQNQLCFRPIS